MTAERLAAALAGRYRRERARGVGLLRIWIDRSARVDTIIAPSLGGVRPEDVRVSPDGR